MCRCSAASIDSITSTSDRSATLWSATGHVRLSDRAGAHAVNRRLRSCGRFGARALVDDIAQPDHLVKWCGQRINGWRERRRSTTSTSPARDAGVLRTRHMTRSCPRSMFGSTRRGLMHEAPLRLRDPGRPINLSSRTCRRGDDERSGGGSRISPSRSGPSWPLTGFDLTVPARATLALVGRNGAGKSTTLKVLAGVLPPTSGEASVSPGSMPCATPTKPGPRVGYCPDVGG